MNNVLFMCKDFILYVDKNGWLCNLRGTPTEGGTITKLGKYKGCNIMSVLYKIKIQQWYINRNIKNPWEIKDETV